VQQHCATFFEQADASVGADLPQFVKDEFDAAEAFARRVGPGGGTTRRGAGKLPVASDRN